MALYLGLKWHNRRAQGSSNCYNSQPKYVDRHMDVPTMSLSWHTFCLLTLQTCQYCEKFSFRFLTCRYANLWILCLWHIFYFLLLTFSNADFLSIPFKYYFIIIFNLCLFVFSIFLRLVILAIIFKFSTTIFLKSP